jgi:hypothetical protein
MWDGGSSCGKEERREEREERPEEIGQSLVRIIARSEGRGGMFQASRPMQAQRIGHRLSLFLIPLIGGSYSKSPVTHRSQFNMLPEPLMRSVGEAAYPEMLALRHLERGTPDHNRLRAVGKRISTIAKVRTDIDGATR